MASKPAGFYQGTSVATAKTLADIIGEAIPADADFCLVNPESQNVRWRDDGTNPTASVGMVLEAGQTLVVTRGQLSRIKFIEVAASTKLNINFYTTG